ncbi:hypothetical protein FRC16_005211, partial [Serendipita sp. 398]
ELIKAKKSNTFSDIDADALALYHVNITDDDDDDLERTLNQLFNSGSPPKRLKPTKKLSTVFSGTPPEERVHILVVLPETDFWDKIHRSSDYTGGERGANADPFSDPPANNNTGNAAGYTAPSGPPPGLGPYEHSGNANRDDGFDPKMLEAVMKASEVETRGNSARAGANGEGSGAAFK